jgi:HSP20 family protein
MNLIRREPVTPFPFFPRFETPFFREFEEMSDRLNKLFTPRTRPFEFGEKLTVAEWLPPVDIAETEKEYLFKVELPEVKKEEINISFHEGVLTIEGERKVEKEEKGKKYHRIERSYGNFLRSFTLPKDADENKITAEFKDGLLLVHVLKTDKPRPKTVEVKFVS